MVNQLQPGIYQLKYKKEPGYSLEYKKNNFTVEGKNYGDIDKHVNLYWSRFRQAKNSMGVMLTGNPGSGKSRVAELLANTGVANNMCVVMVSDVEIHLELIQFIDCLYNTVIMFEEFSKYVHMSMQNKMLTMFSSIGNNKKLFIITENDIRSVSSFIRNRPGRMRYAHDYDRVSEDVVNEVCKDYNVDEAFVAEIFKVYEKALKFTFDHLMTLVTESKALPGYSMDDLLAVLNLDGLLAPQIWNVTKVIEITTKLDWNFKTNRYDTGIDKRYLKSPRFRLWIDLVPKASNYKKGDEIPDSKGVVLTQSNIKKIDDDAHVFDCNGFIITLDLIE